MKDKEDIMSIGDIKENFLVRLELNLSHVEFLKSLVDAGEKLPPPLVSEGDCELIDGRHRIAAYKLRGDKEIIVHTRKFKTQAEKIATALSLNLGGSLPPSKGDISHVLELLLSVGESRRSIIELVSAKTSLPPRLIKDHLDYVQANIAKARLRKAVQAVTDKGMTVPEAAATFAVNITTLKSKLGGKIEDEGASDINQVKSHLSQQFGKINRTNGQALSKVIRDLKDGLLQPEEVKPLVEHLGKLAHKSHVNYENWLKRFESHMGTVSDVQKVSRDKAYKPSMNLGRKALNRMGLNQ